MVLRSVLLQLTVSSSLVVHCSSGGPFPSHFAFAVNTQPSWSADGDRIAYCHQVNSSENGQQNTGPREIWVYSFSKDASVFWAIGSEPAWSPDGDRLAYIAPDDRLWITSGPESADAKMVAPMSGACSPRWSPDGRQILFRRELPGRAPMFYVVNATGTGLISTQVEGVAADFLGNSETLVYAQADERTLSTVRWRTSPNLPAFLASVAPDATHFLQTLPDGDISYCRIQPQGYKCWVMTSSGREPKPIADCAGPFSWSPDGEKIVLEREESGSIDLWVLTVGSNHEEKLLPASES